jgi:E3 ubiquitin-protein ligase NEDD4
MVKHIYKHILGWPMMFADLKDTDKDYYEYLKHINDMVADLDHLGLAFTFTEDILGVKETVELIPGGNNTIVKEEN